jgi:hypothetical protein
LYLSPVPAKHALEMSAAEIASDILVFTTSSLFNCATFGIGNPMVINQVMRLRKVYYI